jgi:hypothetical protein
VDLLPSLQDSNARRRARVRVRGPETMSVYHRTGQRMKAT